MSLTPEQRKAAITLMALAAYAQSGGQDSLEWDEVTLPIHELWMEPAHCGKVRL